MISLYPDQEEFLGEIRKLWPHHNRFVAMAGTGFGKTRVAAKIIEGCINKGMRVCFLVPRISLIAQTHKAFNDLGIHDITYLWAGHEYKPSCRVTIASIDTYIRRDKIRFDLVCHDECHHRRAVLLDWMESHPEERFLGLSATPFGEWMGKYYTALAKSKSMRWLIDNKRLAHYEVFAPQCPDLSKARKGMTNQGYDYVESDLEEIMGGAKVVGDIVGHWLEHGENRLTMALCVNVSHANHLCVEFQKSGVTAEVVSAKVPVEDRERIFKRMREGITRVVLSVNCLTEGFDIKEITCLINARPTKSKARYVQGMGRALRYLPDKVALIFDHSGTTLDLGMPEDIDITELANGKEKTQSESKRQEEEKPEKKPKKCPKCSYLKPAGVHSCPKCGFTPISGEDVEVDTTRGLEKIGKVKKYSIQEKQRFYSECLGYQNERMFKGKAVSDGYIAHLYKTKFGVWPKGMNKTASIPSTETRNFIKSRQIAFAKRKQLERT